MNRGMKNDDIAALKMQLKVKDEVSLSVRGNSMSPIIQSGDKVTITTSEQYCLGDVLVFEYKEEGLLIHRLVDIDNMFLCKGDNAFRLEDVPKEDIVGKVIEINEKPMVRWNKEEVKLSYKVHVIYEKYDKDMDAIMKSDLFRQFKKLLIYKTIIAHRENKDDKKSKKSNL